MFFYILYFENFINHKKLSIAKIYKNNKITLFFIEIILVMKAFQVKHT